MGSCDVGCYNALQRSIPEQHEQIFKEGKR